jgi:hypothetical protein
MQKPRSTIDTQDSHSSQQPPSVSPSPTLFPKLYGSLQMIVAFVNTFAYETRTLFQFTYSFSSISSLFIIIFFIFYFFSLCGEIQSLRVVVTQVLRAFLKVKAVVQSELESALAVSGSVPKVHRSLYTTFTFWSYLQSFSLSLHDIVLILRDRRYGSQS